MQPVLLRLQHRERQRNTTHWVVIITSVQWQLKRSALVSAAIQLFISDIGWRISQRMSEPRQTAFMFQRIFVAIPSSNAVFLVNILVSFWWSNRSNATSIEEIVTIIITVIIIVIAIVGSCIEHHSELMPGSDLMDSPRTVRARFISDGPYVPEPLPAPNYAWWPVIQESKWWKNGWPITTAEA